MQVDLTNSTLYGENFVVANDVDRSFTNRYNGIQVKFMNLDTLIAEILPFNRREKTCLKTEFLL
ncbi:hypothetical protein C6500_04920 [Candidatus Poribacteria bacterium]|nr:MAG: hypothetical protein C6500_04920 [Candidatus Poribacteria bacterium]